ncbi:MAG: minichromosome maintenance protein MCM [Methermicoccaceae archaeon]
MELLKCVRRLMGASSETKWEKFFHDYYQAEVDELLVHFPEKKSLYVDFAKLETFESRLANELLDEPESVLGDATAALEKFHVGDETLKGAHVRILRLPKSAHIMVKDLRSEHIGRFVAIPGLIRKITEVRPRVTRAVFRCDACGGEVALSQTRPELIEPKMCPDEDCESRFLTLIPEKSEFLDTQKLRIQEAPEELGGGEQPQTLDVKCEDDLAGKVYPGDRVVIVGILRIKNRSERDRKTPLFDLVLDGNSIEVMEQEFEELEIIGEDIKKIEELSERPTITQMIKKSIAPSIYGYEDIKEAIALQLFSGVPKFLPDGTQIRGDIHILLVGDPGIAKSQLLRYVVRLAPRGIYTSGKSTTSAGLTATAVKDEFGDGRWTLEAGALVMADKGIAAVDELDKMRTDDRSALHEAMEQQTVSVAKAGILATLKSRCALLGAANPKLGRFDEYVPIAEQINMAPALLSRFDLIFVMKDRPEQDYDNRISEHILGAHYAGELIEKRKRASGAGISQDEIDRALESIQPDIDPELLRKYIAYARREVFPVMEQSALEALKKFYVGLRAEGNDENAPVPVTARQLEALVRLAESSARMRLSENITVEDAKRTIQIVSTSLDQVAKDPETGRLDSDILSVGRSKTQRDKIKIILDIIKELQSTQTEGAPEHEIIEEAEAEGIDEDRTKELLNKMRIEGQLYRPTLGFYRLVYR